MKIYSIRKSLTIWYLLILATLLTIFSVSLYSFFKSSLTQSVDGALLANAKTILTLKSVMIPSKRDVMSEAIRQALGISEYPVFTQVVNLSGKVNFQSNIDNRRLPLSQLAKSNGEKGILTYENVTDIDKYPVRLLTAPVMYNNFFTGRFIQVATSLKSVEYTLRRVLLFFLIAIPSALGIVSLGGVFLASKALAPVRNMIAAAKQISVRNLNQELTVLTEDREIKDLAVTFNQVFSDLHNSFTNISRFSSDVSHELKTPLTIIRGQTELVLRKPRESQEYIQTLQSNLEEVNNMTQIVEHLSLLSKLERKDDFFEYQTISVIDLLSKTVEGLLPIAEQKGVSIRFEDPFALSLEGDPLMIKLVFVNIIGNAIKYTVPNDQIEIETFVQSDNQGVRVIDHGPGIESEDIDKLFERFYRAEKSRSKDTGGSGLGLNIARSIIDRHGGSITVTSDPNERTCFEINLPKS